MLTDFRKPLLRISLVAGFTEPLKRGGEVVKDKQRQPVVRSTIGFKTCRHTYCCARLATLDRGAPASQDTVARELGHSSTDLVQEVYGAPRNRAEPCGTGPGGPARGVAVGTG
jgi:integrase